MTRPHRQLDRRNICMCSEGCAKEGQLWAPLKVRSFSVSLCVLVWHNLYDDSLFENVENLRGKLHWEIDPVRFWGYRI